MKWSSIEKGDCQQVPFSTAPSHHSKLKSEPKVNYNKGVEGGGLKELFLVREHESKSLHTWELKGGGAPQVWLPTVEDTLRILQVPRHPDTMASWTGRSTDKQQPPWSSTPLKISDTMTVNTHRSGQFSDNATRKNKCGILSSLNHLVPN